MGQWENRELCPDGACVGVIGQDGTCAACGRVAPNWGDERRRGMADADDELLGSEEPAAAPEHPPGVIAPTDDDWDQRKLCPDGDCVGVIDILGRCSVCGGSAT